MSRGRRISRVKFIVPSKETALKYLREWDSRTLFQAPDTYPPLESQSLFNCNTTMILDIGCGTGEFLLALAQNKPDKKFLGVELSRRAIYHAVNQAKRLELENILFIKADIRLLYPLFRPNTFETVHLNFPDPNYGARHRKNRIFTNELLEHFHSALIPGGLISVVTDQRSFVIDMLEIAERDLRFMKNHPERFLTHFDPQQKTRFQTAWERFDRSVFRFELVKIA